MKRLLSSAAAALLWVALTPGAAHADDTLKRVQQSLRDQGFYYGTLDGVPGDETTQAIRRYQIRNGLQVNGQLNDETRAAILRNAGGGSAAAGNGGNVSVTPTGTPRPRSTPSVSSPPRPVSAPRADYGDEGGFHRNGGAPVDPPINRVGPGRPAPEAEDNGGDVARPAPRQPVPDAPERPDLRVAPGQDDRSGPPSGEGRAMPRGIAPSTGLTALFEGTSYEFAPPPVQSDILRRAQRRLLRQGFYDREPDGRLNAVTGEALTNFQGFNHLRRTGRLDSATLGALRLQPGQLPPGARGEGELGNAGPRRGGQGGVYEGRLVQ